MRHLVTLLIFVYCVQQNNANLSCDLKQDDDRFDCFPEPGSNEKECVKEDAAGESQ